MSVTLRRATRADLDAITGVLLSCWRENIGAVAPASAIAAINPERVTALWSKVLDGMDDGAAVVAESDSGTVMGTTRYERLAGGKGIVHSLYVSPRAQRRGIGARLLAAAVQGLCELDAAPITLWVIASNTPSIAFYRTQGWTPDGATRTQPGFGIEELRLEYSPPTSDTTLADPPPATAHPLANSDPHPRPDREQPPSEPLTRATRERVGTGPGRGRPPSEPVARVAWGLAGAGTSAPAGVAIGLRTVDGEAVGVAGARTVGDGARPMTPGTSHDLASVTKIVATTTALMGLVSDGAVRLDDPVCWYLPGFTGDGKDAVTIRHLLRHRGGLWEWQPLYLSGRSGAEAVRYVERLPLRYAPDTARHYSDLGFILLGRVIEIAGGCGLEAAVRQLVTAPLRLHATVYAAPPAPTTSVAVSDDPPPVTADRRVSGEQPADSRLREAARPSTTASGRVPGDGGTGEHADTDEVARYPDGVDVAASALGDVTERRMVATGEPYPVIEADTGFASWRSRFIVGEVNDGNAFHAFGGVSGHAGLFSTLGDLLTYGTALANYRDHGSLWRPGVVEEFLADGPDPEQALGFRRYRLSVGGEATTVYGHPGFVGCAVGFAPAAGIALALCSNRLLATATPMANDDLWSHARHAAELTLAAEPASRGGS